MSTNQPYTLQDVQDRINTLVNNDVDTPETDDDEWSIRLNLIYQAIGDWERQPVFWDELWTTYTHATPVVDSDTTYVIAATNFRNPPSGYVRLVLNGATEHIPVISPEQKEAYGDIGRVCYFTGNNKDGWTLNLGWTPVTGDNVVGASIIFDYYKLADRPTLTTDKFEMSDPNFIIYQVAANKSLLESKNNQYSVFANMAGECMDTMRTMNAAGGNYSSNLIEDVDALSSGASLGD